MNQFILILIAILILAIIVFLGLFFFAWSAKKTLLRGETAWSAKNIPIRRNKPSNRRERGSSLLEAIYEETNEYLGSPGNNE
tara:strand:- start:109 stop:354 length:246 start_codon:yes stop_codon:yes gene_type:complete